MRTPLVKSAARVLDLLELLAAAPRPLRLAEVAPRLDIPKTSAFALLSTLVAKGYAEEQGGGYRLAGRLRDRGWVGGDVAHMVRVSRAVMAELTQTTGESVFLGVLTPRSEEHTSELQSLMRISYAVFCLKKKNIHNHTYYT